ncbi:4730_t:CDS:1 [Gigaspora margarita]|uniref:4730_t:CDS:1 n=1 Tax=Gigaspora margarita TaxID=4874 RepID=A0ABN7VCY0_GIGMA|nr:4730_t:CDS:1 [Gigaspora margarita]
MYQTLVRYLFSESETKISDASLVKLNENLRDAADNLKIACLSLRSCYTNNTFSDNEFTELRKNITIYAKVYGLKIMPFANSVIQNIQEFIEPYILLDTEEFKEYVAKHAKNAHKHYLMACHAKQLHMKILEYFKKEQDKTTVILRQQDLVYQHYKRRADYLQTHAERRYNWAIALAFFPVVNLIACPILKIKGDEAKAHANWCEEKAAFKFAVIEVIRDVLIKSLDNFTNTLESITKFFQIIEYDLERLTNVEQHYKIIKNKANEIKESCQNYTACIPARLTDLASIPGNFNERDAEQWLSEHGLEIDGRYISYLKGDQILFKEIQED